MTKRQNFYLPQGSSISVAALSGSAEVSVETCGRALVTRHGEGVAPRERPVTIAETERGVMRVSPKGWMTTVKVILPTSMADEAEFVHQVHMLFREMEMPRC